jgi:ABC-2 type transport system ATP-binding protein
VSLSICGNSGREHEANAMSEFVLQTEALSKRYGRRVVVDRLSLSVEKGDIFGFLGQNGAGKSTTIRMMLGLVRPTSGRVIVLGHDMARQPRRALQRVGAIIEAPAFYENFSGRQNLRMLAAMSGGAERKRIEEVLDIVGLRARADDRVQVYSHGMRQRLGIAQALLPHPQFVILDEPTDGLDPQGLAETRTLIKRLREELGLTIMLSSHLLHEVEQICNRVAIIDEGRLLFQGPVDDLIAGQSWINLRVDRLTEAFALLEKEPGVSVNLNGDQALHLKIDEAEIPRVNALLVSQGFRVKELSPQRESLEDVFLRLTRTVNKDR